eukprot:gene23488-17307_t
MDEAIRARPALPPSTQYLPRQLVTDELTRGLQGLYDIPGMELAIKHVSNGHFIDNIRLEELGQRMMGSMSQPLHYALREMALSMGMEEPPTLYEFHGLPTGQLAALIQCPNVNDSEWGKGPSSPRANASASLGGVRLGSGREGQSRFSWKRVPLVLLAPGVLDALEGLEAEALMAMALAPMCLPGGGGWRMNLGLKSADKGGTTGQTGFQGGQLEPVVNCALADVVTTISLHTVNPSVVVGQLPSQLQMKWKRLLQTLQDVRESAVTTADRVALLMVQDVGTVARVIYKTCMGLERSCPTGEELVVQVSGVLFPRETNLELGSGGIDAQGAGGQQLQRVLERIRNLLTWSNTAQYKELLQNGLRRSMQQQS